MSYRRLSVFAFLSVLLFANAWGEDTPLSPSEYWKTQIESAAAGETVVIPPGQFEIADVVIPDGVTIRGSGYLQTLFDASNGKNGLVITGQQVRVSGLTVHSAPESGVFVSGAREVQLSGLRLQGCLNGVTLGGESSDVRVENCILADNRTGASLTQSDKLIFVNNTLHNNGSLGYAIIGLRNSAVFNNVLSDSVIGAYIDDLESTEVDYNLYKTTFPGTAPGQVRVMTVQRLHALTGTDKHSVQQQVKFVNPAEGNFTPATPMPWARHEPVTAFFAVAELGAAKAPSVDILGAARDSLQLGAVQATGLPMVEPAGTFEVKVDDGVISAGIYTPAGTQLVRLFDNLPLAAGSYPFTWPARDWQGQELSPGDYELRIAESSLDMEYLGVIFNTGIKPTSKLGHDSLSTALMDFAPDGRVLIGYGWSESHYQVRCYDSDYQQVNWGLNGTENLIGMDVDTEADTVYLLRASRSVARFGLEQGAPVPFSAENPTLSLGEILPATVQGLAVLGNQLYASDPESGTLFKTDKNNPTFEASVSIPGAKCVSSDPESDRLWLISGSNTVLCVDAEGTEVKRHEFPFSVDVLTAAEGKLGLLSRETGKVEIYDVDAAGTLSGKRVLGTGDISSGPFRDNTFTFKNEPNLAVRRVALGLREDGAVLINDNPRLLFYGPDDKLIRSTYGVWGQHVIQGLMPGDTQTRFWNINAGYSITTDAKTGSWSPDGLWSYPRELDGGRACQFFFSDDGRRFAAFNHGIFFFKDGTIAYTKKAFEEGKEAGKKGAGSRPEWVIVEFDEHYRGRSVVAWYSDPANELAWTRRLDTNGDGTINDLDEKGTAVLDAGGKPFSFHYDTRLTYPQTKSRDILITSSMPGPDAIGIKVRYAGLDEAGLPSWDWGTPEEYHVNFGDEKALTFRSPYDFTTPETINSHRGEHNLFSDGTVVYSMKTKTGGGTGLGHISGSDVVAAGPDGMFRWFFPAPLTEGLHGVQVMDDILVFQDFTDMDWYMVNPDGLGLGIAGIPKDMQWQGMWNDHPKQFRLYEGNDGDVYAVLGDYVINGFHHFKLTGQDSIKTRTKAITLPEPKATVLASQYGTPIPATFEAPKFQIKIKRLDAPLPIDGELQKWRDIGLSPQVIVTPEAAKGDVDGPKDISGVIRLAHENGNLYVQCLKFDDVVTMHQPLAKHYLQDSFEMCINSFLKGFKFNVTRTQEHGETLFRDKFFVTKFNKVFTQEEAPHVIRVLDNAKDVPERELIEAVYGVDLSDSKVIVTEFKLPLDLALEGMPKDLRISGASGDTMWLGFMLDDNDQPGADIQDLIVYPATYGTFAVMEKSALATFE